MYHGLKYILLLFFLSCSFLENLHAQTKKKEQRKLFYRASDYFYEEKFNEALKILLVLDTIPLKNFLNKKKIRISTDTVSIEKIYVKYLISSCYLEMKEEKKALPYVEFYVNAGFSKTPAIIYKDLAKIYHENYQFGKAIYYYRKYLLEEKEDPPPYFDEISHMISVCQNAREIIKDTLKNEIQNIGEPINTKNSETAPFVSKDDKLMVYTTTVYRKKSEKSEELTSTKHVKIAYKELGIWKRPSILVFDSPDKDAKPTVIGMFPNGKKLIVRLDKGDRHAYYFGTLKKTRCLVETKLEFFNSKYFINRMSITDDGNEIYYSSNASDGFGGMDIYKIEKTGDGRWRKPVNLGNKINTKFDEDMPVIDANKKTLYFASNGQNTMGGFDVFKAELSASGEWDKIVNIGFPLNTPQDNFDFSLSNSGKKGYFTASQFDEYNNYDIYTINLQENIPLTLINGTLIAGMLKMPVDAKIKVINHPETDSGSGLLVNTNPKIDNGKYYVFCPPGKDYNILIEAAGYLPQLVNIHVPKQRQFYELFQEIQLKPIKVLNKKLGEEIVVKNNFYDLTKGIDSLAHLGFDTESPEYKEMLQIISELSKNLSMDTKNYSVTVEPKEEKNYKMLNDFIMEAIEEQDSTALERLKHQTHSQEKYTQSYFFPEDSTQENLNKVKIGDRIVFTTPPLEAKTKLSSEKEKDIYNLIKANQLSTLLSRISEQEMSVNGIALKDLKKSVKTILTFQVFFPKNVSNIDSTYNDKLQEIADLLVNNPNLFLQIDGYADPSGSSDENMLLSKKRAEAVQKFFIDSWIDMKRMVIHFYGETKASNMLSLAQPEKERRVDIKILDIQIK